MAELNTEGGPLEEGGEAPIAEEVDKGGEGEPDKGQGTDEGEPTGEEGEPEGEPASPDAPAVPVRRTVADFVAERRGRKIEKLEKGGGVESGNSPVEAQVASALDKMFGPVAEALQGRFDDSDVTTFLAKPENAAFKPFEKQVRSAMGVYKNVPINLLFQGFAYKGAAAGGAAAERTAIAEGKKNRARGTAINPVGKGVKVPEVGSKELAAMEQGFIEGSITLPGQEE